MCTNDAAPVRWRAVVVYFCRDQQQRAENPLICGPQREAANGGRCQRHELLDMGGRR